MDSVIIVNEPNEEKYIEKYEDVVDWNFKNNAVEVLNVINFSHKKGDRGCLVKTEKHGEIKFSKGSQVIRGD